MINKTEHKNMMGFKEYCSSRVPMDLAKPANQITINFLTYHRIRTAIKRPIISEVEYYKMLEPPEEIQFNLPQKKIITFWDSFFDW